MASGDAGDSLNAPWDSTKSSTGMKFSSQDADHDMSWNNCALETGGGWWFNDCSHSNMLGDPHVVGYQWYGLTDVGVNSAANAVLMANRMMIKAVVN